MIVAGKAIKQRLPGHTSALFPPGLQTVHRFEGSFADPDEVYEAMAAVTSSRFGVHPLRAGAFRWGVTAARLRDTALFRVSSTPARVLGDDPWRGFSINLPLAAPMRFGPDESVQSCSADSLFLLRPGERLNVRFPHAVSCLVLNVFRSDLDDFAASLNGGRQDEPFLLPSRLPLESAAGRAFRRFLLFLWSEVQRDGRLLQSDEVTANLETALLTSLICTAGLTDRGEAKQPRSLFLRRAVDYILSDPSNLPSLADIARASGASARTLQRAFRRHYGVSVMEFVRCRRLERAHRQLLDADPSVTTVTEIANANGFLHVSRFSDAFRRRFGEYPSQTLRLPR